MRSAVDTYSIYTIQYNIWCHNHKQNLIRLACGLEKLKKGWKFWCHVMSAVCCVQSEFLCSHSSLRLLPSWKDFDAMYWITSSVCLLFTWWSIRIFSFFSLSLFHVYYCLLFMPISSLYHTHTHTRAHTNKPSVEIRSMCACCTYTFFVYLYKSNRFGFCFGCWRWTLAYYFLLMFSSSPPPYLPLSLSRLMATAITGFLGLNFGYMLIEWNEVHDVDLSGMLFIFFWLFQHQNRKWLPHLLLYSFLCVLFSLCSLYLLYVLYIYRNRLPSSVCIIRKHWKGGEHYRNNNNNLD